VRPSHVPSLLGSALAAAALGDYAAVGAAVEVLYTHFTADVTGTKVQILTEKVQTAVGNGLALSSAPSEIKVCMCVCVCVCRALVGSERD
jgi:hypothetical protein